ncbi:hypothetical protein OSTOST_07313 [Ostertagia ostertagi]
MQQSKFVVVEVTTTTSTMTLIQYLITNGFDKFAVLSDLSDHPSLKYKVTSPASGSQPNNGNERHPPNVVATNERNGKPKVSINEIASALSRKSSPSQPKNGFCVSVCVRSLNSSPHISSVPPPPPFLQLLFASLHSILREEIGLAFALFNNLRNHSVSRSPELDDVGILDSSTVNLSGTDTNGAHDTDHGADSSDGGLGPSDEQVRASMIHLLNPVLGSAFGLCGKPTTLNSTGSRWNLLRHVIMIHSDSKPYQCWDCDFIGIKSNVISHARQTNHRSDDAHDITTDVMRSEWNTMLHQCFPDYVKAKSRGWQASNDDADADAVVAATIESPEIKAEL